MDHSENEDITLKRSDSTDKVLKPGEYSSDMCCGDRLVVVSQQEGFDCVFSQPLSVLSVKTNVCLVILCDNTDSEVSLTTSHWAVLCYLSAVIIPFGISFRDRRLPRLTAG